MGTTLTPETTLLGAVDAEERFARFPRDFTLKGMFFSRLLEIGGEHAQQLRDTLKAPPRLGRYLPFADYPQVDYSRIAHAVAAGLFPHLPVREAMRHLARLDYATFARSTLGRVSLALTADLPAALQALPNAFRAVMSGGDVDVIQHDPRSFEIEFHEFYGWVDCYPVGTVEGMVDHFGQQCSIELDLRSPVDAAYFVTIL